MAIAEKCRWPSPEKGKSASGLMVGGQECFSFRLEVVSRWVDDTGSHQAVCVINSSFHQISLTTLLLQLGGLRKSQASLSKPHKRKECCPGAVKQNPAFYFLYTAVSELLGTLQQY